MPPSVSIDTPRLLLRLPEAADAGPFMEIHEDPEVLPQVTLMGPVGGVAVAWRNVAIMIGHWHLRGYGHWTVVEKTTEQVIERVGLFNPDGWPGIELGWVIRRSRWNNGFATEAARAALAWAWENVDTDHIISLIQPDNLASIRIATKLGERFERIETLNSEVIHVYGITRSRSQIT